MRVEIEFADDVDLADAVKFMERLYNLVGGMSWVFKEIRIVREPKQTE